MKAYVLIRLQLDGLEFINYEDTKTLTQFFLHTSSFASDFIGTLLTDL